MYFSFIVLIFQLLYINKYFQILGGHNISTRHTVYIYEISLSGFLSKRLEINMHAKFLKKWRNKNVCFMHYSSMMYKRQHQSQYK